MKNGLPALTKSAGVSWTSFRALFARDTCRHAANDCGDLRLLAEDGGDRSIGANAVDVSALLLRPEVLVDRVREFPRQLVPLPRLRLVADVSRELGRLLQPERRKAVDVRDDPVARRVHRRPVEEVPREHVEQPALVDLRLHPLDVAIEIAEHLVREFLVASELVSAPAPSASTKTSTSAAGSASRWAPGSR